MKQKRLISIKILNVSRADLPSYQVRNKQVEELSLRLHQKDGEKFEKTH